MKLKKPMICLFTLMMMGGCNKDYIVDYVKSTSPEKMLKDFTVTKVKSNNAQVILDNDMAFNKKLEIIKSAENELRLAYYIFSNDASSAVLANEIIKAAVERNVKVKILIDLHYEYKNFDFFSAIEKAGNGNIEIKFYGRPALSVMKDVVYLTSACPEEIGTGSKCASFKNKQIKKAVPALKEGKFDNGVSGLFLSGLYSKDFAVLANAVMNGQDIDIADFQSDDGSTMSDEDKKGLLEFVKIYFKSKMSSSFFERIYNKLKLRVALIKYADEISPIYGALQQYLPVNSPNRDKAKDGWAHLTDFAHHKLLIADGKKMQLGGRNVENSYHMRPNALISKYIFMDTDVYADVEEGGAEVEESFDRLYGYSPLTMTIAEIKTMMPNDLIANRRIISKKCGHINEKESPKEYKECSSKYENLTAEDREYMQMKKLAKNVADYSTYSPKSLHPLVEKYVYSAGQGGYFNVSPEADLHYLENVPYVTEDGKAGKRVYGTKINGKNFKSKGIHGVWIYNFLRSCMVSKKEKRNIDITLNNAYFFPSAELLHTFSRMIDGKFDCSRVTVNMITNSPKTTDLGPVNLLAQMSMRAFFTSLDHAAIKKLGKGKSATFKLYEYNDLAVDKNSKSESLHTKVIAFDKSIYIGSANFDTRSIVLDTNNGFYITNDQKLVDDYKGLMQARIDGNMVSLVADSSTENMYKQVSTQQIIDASWKEIDEKFLQRESMTPERKEGLYKKYKSVMKKVFKYTQNIIHGKVMKKIPVGESNTALRNRVITDVRALGGAFKKFNLLTKEI